MKQMIQEIKVQMFFNHPNLVKLYSFFSDFTKVYLLMELGCDGQLYELVKDGEKFTEETSSYLVRQTMLGISEMHKNFVIHRDIKPENIVLVHVISLWNIGSSENLWLRLVGLLPKRSSLHPLWHSSLSIAWNPEGKHLQREDWYMGNWNISPWTDDRAKSLWNKEKIRFDQNYYWQCKNGRKYQRGYRLCDDFSGKRSWKEAEVWGIAEPPIPEKVWGVGNLLRTVRDDKQKKEGKKMRWIAWVSS